MNNFYIGRFPPPYGGVTIKNNIVFNRIIKSVRCSKFDVNNLKGFKLKYYIKFVNILLSRQNVLVIGVSGEWRKKITEFIYFFNRKTLNKSILIVMGGNSVPQIINDKDYKKYLTEYKKIFVETNGMKSQLESHGLLNVDVFPNCREISMNKIKVKTNIGQKLKLIYFSQISKEKGADIVISAAKRLELQNIEFKIDFFGIVQDNFKDFFYNSIEGSLNLNYCGVFESDKENVYELLNNYDILLFPSRWKHEGVPGVLVESKISGITSIVSNINYNSEIVKDNINGIVIKNNTPTDLVTGIKRLNSDRNFLFNLKRNSYISKEYFLLDRHIYKIIDLLQ